MQKITKIKIDNNLKILIALTIGVISFLIYYQKATISYYRKTSAELNQNLSRTQLQMRPLTNTQPAGKMNKQQAQSNGLKEGAVLEKVSFCGKIFNTEPVFLDNIDVAKRIAILSQNNNRRICQNIAINAPDGYFSTSIKKQETIDAEYKDGVYFVILSPASVFKIDKNTNMVYVLSAHDGSPTLLGKFK
jgi:hypothetical protein